MKVLYVEDDVRDADLTRRELARSAPQFEVEVVGTLSEAQARLAGDADFDIVLADIHLPDGKGTDLLEQVRNRPDAPAMLAITGTDSCEVALSAFKAGATGCILKRGDYLVRLPRTLAAALERHGAGLAHEVAGIGREAAVVPASRAFLQAILKTLTAHIAILDRRGVIVAVNQAWQDFGVQNGGSGDAVAPIGRNYLDFCGEAPEAPKANVREGILAVLQGSLPRFSMEYPCHSPNSERWFSLNVTPDAESGQYVIVAHEDITQRKYAEASLRHSEMRYRALFQQAGVGVAEMDRASGRFIEVNRKFAEIVGYEPAELLQLTFMDISYPDDMPANTALREQLLQNEIPDFSLDKRYVRKDGSLVWVNLTVSPIWEADGSSTRNLSVVKDITPRKLAESALVESEARYRSIYENIQDVFLESTVDGTLIEVSPQISILSRGQYRREDLIGKSAAGFYASPEERTVLLRTLLEHGSVRDFETTLRNRDGTHIPVSVSGRLVLDQRVRSQRLVFTLRDITERKRAADALTLLTTGVAYLRGEAFYRYLSEQVSKLLGEPIGFISKVVGADHDRVRIIALCVDGHATPGVEFNLAGTPCADALERGVIVIPEGAQQAFPSAGVFAELKVSGYAAVALRDSTGGVMGNVGVMSRAPLREPGQVESILRLFAVRIAREMEREAADWKFRDLFEYSPDGNVIVNQAGIITMVNRQAESMFGYSRQELVGQTLEILLPQADRPGHDRLRHGYVRDPQTRSMGASRRDLHALRKDGTVFPVDISLNPLHSDEGMQVVAAVRDVSARVQDQEQRKALEAQLVQAQKMEAVGTLAGGIAHDFNNILSAIIGNVVLAREDVGANSPVLQSLDEILVASRRARDLVGQILAFSRQQRNEVSPVALPSVVGEVIALLRGTLPAGVEITSRHSAGLPDILADATHVHQILMNLCTNAIQAVGREGRIDIEIEDVLLDERTRPVGTDLKPGRYVRLAVRDNGTGMDEQTCRRVFEPFFTTKDVGKGTGLGLSVVHGIVRSYGGAIMVRSSPGAGSTFVLHFPASNVWAGATPDQSVPVTERRGGGQRILYVDDDEMLLFLVKRALERQGYQVSTYSNQEDALQALRANPSQFSLVLTDYTMPGMSGLDVAREVSRIRSDLPVAVTTGYITDSLRAEAPAAGVRELIYKPNSAEALCETVQRLLENGS